MSSKPEQVDGEGAWNAALRPGAVPRALGNLPSRFRPLLSPGNCLISRVSYGQTRNKHPDKEKAGAFRRFDIDGWVYGSGPAVVQTAHPPRHLEEETLYTLNHVKNPAAAGDL